MDIDIRGCIKQNFKGATEQEIIDSIVNSINDKEEITLPGMGVFFEILWEKSNEELHKQIINILKNNL
ncbi:MAG: small acid-soluble spore protein SspI [Bacilli bacterium]|nr:small acid-soluble spore protein SspI [Bacilli bacterium]